METTPPGRADAATACEPWCRPPARAETEAPPRTETGSGEGEVEIAFPARSDALRLRPVTGCDRTGGTHP
ncbi:hypothetical protein Shyd_75560 [Streptomyces hydrogenans]|uniref:Uncharacterized protein n=1 Tax=Streptomyces hydrogenans TaxID=1873719 RepID=A0ABQ3PME8_9ACTN|nr:hypothetical protein Shyd_75560 [Streptomyces hydrogenans]